MSTTLPEARQEFTHALCDFKHESERLTIGREYSDVEVGDLMALRDKLGAWIEAVKRLRYLQSQYPKETQ